MRGHQTHLHQVEHKVREIFMEFLRSYTCKSLSGHKKCYIYNSSDYILNQHRLSVQQSQSLVWKLIRFVFLRKIYIEKYFMYECKISHQSLYTCLKKLKMLEQIFFVKIWWYEMEWPYSQSVVRPGKNCLDIMIPGFRRFQGLVKVQYIKYI